MKPFDVYQYLEGTEMTDRDKKEIGSKFWNKGKWDNFVLPFLPQDVSEMTLIDIGCNAGLFLKLAQDKGFRNILGVDSNPDAIERGAAWRDKNGGKYRLLCMRMEGCVDILPLADYTVLANSHYYFSINDWIDYLDKLQYKTRYCIIVTAEKHHINRCWASTELATIRGYFKYWDETGFIDELPFGDDPMPRKLWGLCFKSRIIERIPVGRIETSNDEQDRFYSSLDKGIDYKETRYYWILKKYRVKWGVEKLNHWMEKKVRLYEDVKKNGMMKPILINSINQTLDGNHKYGMLRSLGYKSVLVRKI